nr:mannan endo-1,4-beta-mannosidase 7-like [Ipomoea batatas]
MYVAPIPSQREQNLTAFSAGQKPWTLRRKNWAFSDGRVLTPLSQLLPWAPNNEQMFKLGRWDAYLVRWNFKSFVGMDFVVSEAGNYGIKLILSLVNNYRILEGKISVCGVGKKPRTIILFHSRMISISQDVSVVKGLLL